MQCASKSNEEEEDCQQENTEVKNASLFKKIPLSTFKDQIFKIPIAYLTYACLTIHFTDFHYFTQCVITL